MKKKSLAICIIFVFMLQILLCPICATGNADSGYAYIFTSGWTYSNQNDIEVNFDRFYFDSTFLYNQYATTMYNAIKTKEVVIIDPVSSGKGFVQNTVPNSSKSFLAGCSRNKGLKGETHTNSVFLTDLGGLSNKVNLVTVFLGSYTGEYPDGIEDESQLDGYYYPANLLNATYLRLSKCAVGWKETINGGYTDAWTEAFVYNICSETIADSLSIVSGYMFREFGTIPSEGYTKYLCRGDSTQVIGSYVGS